ncbi:zinc finger protein 395 isoform X2 [Frankliniella occidentalis]|uniref:Zinc finger protein 395 isoform X2 n=1 Tax=Frankliniella occidentalis TaxID=133901 RepID=A0A9C6TTU8_FRAOC|nr:zinc finger protein 395 isoform X2 [Frankliniella occidentalis]
MSTGKRLAKRSIIGTRVCAPGDDGKYYAGVIHAVKTPAAVLPGGAVGGGGPGQGGQGPGDETRYSVRFDTATSSKQQRLTFRREFRESELIGPGFRSVTGCHLQPGQRAYLTFNGREVAGEVRSHDTARDEVTVTIWPPGHEASMDLKKRLDEVRLLESRKSARLADSDTDFARLADMGSGSERKRASSHSIDVPAVQGSRKRRPSSSQDEGVDSGLGLGLGLGDPRGMMDECTAALVLMSLSCSPHSPGVNSGVSWSERLSPSPSSDACSWRSGTPSPPLSEPGSCYWAQGTTDEGIVIDHFDDIPKKKKATRMVFQCTWPGCLYLTTTCASIESHVRNSHLGPRTASGGPAPGADGEDGEDMSDHEEEFYYTEVELGLHTSSPPTLSHRDMARPPHEDPEYQKQLANAAVLKGSFALSSSPGVASVASSGLGSSAASNSSSSSSVSSNSSLGSAAGSAHCASPAALIHIPAQLPPWSSSASAATSPVSIKTSPLKHLKLSPRSGSCPYQPVLSVSAPGTAYKVPGSPTRKVRGDTKKCRKVYGMEHRDQWCTQCKWKKACTRFGD